MSNTEILNEIRDANLNYLMLARQMIRADPAAAIFRLGLSTELVDLLDGLSSAQVVRLASGNMMLARLRLDHQAIRGMLTRTHRDISLSHAHLALIVAAQTVEDIA